MNNLKWWVSFGDDVDLPNICDKNCLGCHDDYTSTNLKNRYVDKRNDLFNKKGFNWFPREWEFKNKWKLKIKKHFGTSKAPKFFLFSGRGDPLFYIPCIEAYMKVYKELGYKGYAIIYTSGTQLTPTMIDHLAQIGSNELRFNLVATDFSQDTLYKMEAVKHQMKVSVQIPLLSIYEKKLFGVLPYLHNLGITQLILCYTYIISQTGAEKLQKVLPKTTVVTKLTDGKAVIDNQPMINNIKDHIRNKKYKIPLLIEQPDYELSTYTLGSL